MCNHFNWHFLLNRVSKSIQMKVRSWVRYHIHQDQQERRVRFCILFMTVHVGQNYVHQTIFFYFLQLLLVEFLSSKTKHDSEKSDPSWWSTARGSPSRDRQVHAVSHLHEGYKLCKFDWASTMEGGGSGGGAYYQLFKLLFNFSFVHDALHGCRFRF